MGIFTRRSPDGQLIETYHDGYELNETGAYIWSHVGSGRTLSEICGSVAAHYDITVDESQRAVEAFLAELQTRGFIVRGGH
jgi:hypothetical protein